MHTSTLTEALSSRANVFLAILPCGVGAFGVMQAGSGHTVEVLGATVLAVAPWILAAALRREPELGLLDVAMSTVGLAALQVLGPTWGWIDRGVNSQLTLLIGVLLVGQVFALSSRKVCGFAVLLMAAVLVSRYLTDDYWARTIIWPIAFAVAAVVGGLVRVLLVIVTDLEEANERLEIQGARSERQRIAREVHDVLAHSMTVTMLNLSAARLAIERGDQTAAVGALAEAERNGRLSLRDIRGTITLLRNDQQSWEDDTNHSLRDVPDLISSWQNAGLEVSLTFRGDDTLDPTARLAAYRIIQESLANASKHMPGGVHEVELLISFEELSIRVESKGIAQKARSTGFGVIGMRERATSLRGSLSAGPTDSGWCVMARIPISSEMVRRP